MASPPDGGGAGQQIGRLRVAGCPTSGARPHQAARDVPAGRTAVRCPARRAGDVRMCFTIVSGRAAGGISAALGGKARVVRATPDTPTTTRQGITCAFAGPGLKPERREVRDTLLCATGGMAWVEDEGLIDPATAVSGGSPADVVLLAEPLETAPMSRAWRPPRAPHSPPHRPRLRCRAGGQRTGHGTAAVRRDQSQGRDRTGVERVDGAGCLAQGDVGRDFHRHPVLAQAGPRIPSSEHKETCSRGSACKHRSGSAAAPWADSRDGKGRVSGRQGGRHPSAPPASPVGTRHRAAPPRSPKPEPSRSASGRSLQAIGSTRRDRATSAANRASVRWPKAGSRMTASTSLFQTWARSGRKQDICTALIHVGKCLDFSSPAPRGRRAARRRHLREDRAGFGIITALVSINDLKLCRR